jgi:N,N'-diacetyllegionaminate synthase
MKKVMVIAEAGVNHNGNLLMALEMVKQAKKAGADIIKFQTAKPELVISRFAEKAEYQKLTTNSNESQLEMCKKIHLKFEDYITVKNECDNLGIQFLSTPFDIESVHFLNNMVPFWKIPSGEITNYPYLVEIGKTQKPVVMSTGMCELSEIDAAIDVLKENGTKDITLLHCNTQYPTPYKDVNLLAMQTLRKRYNTKVGYSDHTQGIEVPIAAVALGADVIEKHFTLDRNLPGPDHKASLEPDELAAMVKSIRNIEAALGDGIKKVTDSERENISIARKSIVALQEIKKGEILTENNITTKRPGTGISPMLWNSVIGTKAIKDFQEDEEIEV